MNKAELREKIKSLALNAYSDIKGGKNTITEKFPTLKDVLVDLMTSQYNLFVEDILWVAPRPTTFRINLLNGQSFFLIFNDRSWTAQIEGKKYYLLNLQEEENAVESIARILKYGNPQIQESSQDEILPPPTEEVPNSDVGAALSSINPPKPTTTVPPEEVPPVV